MNEKPNKVVIQNGVLYTQFAILPMKLVPESCRPVTNVSKKRHREPPSTTTSEMPIKHVKYKAVSEERENIFKILNINYQNYCNNLLYFTNCNIHIKKYLNNKVEIMTGNRKRRFCRFYNYHHTKALECTNEVFDQNWDEPANVIFKHLHKQFTETFKTTNVTMCFEYIFFYFQKYYRDYEIFQMFEKMIDINKIDDGLYMNARVEDISPFFITDSFTEKWGTFLTPIDHNYIRMINNQFCTSIKEKINL
ncbi:hypothetical protein N9T73_00190, partial [bacterium]|nr:hypothetical protein [bacterium]